MVNITPIINALILLISAIVCGVIIPRVKELLEEKIGASNTAELLKWVDIFVTAAEQTIASGPDKKAYVQNALKKLGYELTDDVDSAIEAAVLKLHNSL